ncbi:unnamed protein product, partial [Ectocarpus sp. 13 AM-2016]
TASVVGYPAASYQHLPQSTCESLQLAPKYCSLPVGICGVAYCPGGVASG